jgi:hypothetical protein
MIYPILPAWIEQRGDAARLRIGHLGCSVFVVITIPAGEAKIIYFITPFGVDMVDLHRLTAVRFRSLAVFTAATRSLMYAPLDCIPGQFTHAVK